MKPHQTIFEDLKTILKEYFGEGIKEYEEGQHITISDSGVWISSDEYELTVGYGVNQRHYHCEVDNMQEAINELFDLLFRKKKLTKYYKGDAQFKSKAEIENENGDYRVLSTSLTWLFPFWKKTKVEVSYIVPLITSPKVISRIKELKEYV